MGVYTELSLIVKLKKDTDIEFVGWLTANKKSNGLTGTDKVPTVLKGMFKNNIMQDAYYFNTCPFIHFEYDKAIEKYILILMIHTRGFGGAFSTLLTALTPFIVTEGHIGHIRCDEEYLPHILMREQNGNITKGCVELHEGDAWKI